MANIIELREKREKIVQDQRAILNKAEAEKRGLTADEETNYQNMDVEFESLSAEIEKEVKSAEAARNFELRKKQADEREKLLRQAAGDPIKPEPENRNKKDPKPESEFAEYRVAEKYRPMVEQFRKTVNKIFGSEKYASAYRRYLVDGERHLTSEDRDVLFNADREFRALQADADKAGGYLVAPEQMVMQIIENLDNMVFVRQYANVIPLPSAASLGAPARDTDMGDVTWTSELAMGAYDTSLSFEKRSLTPHPLARMIKVSKRLLRVAMFDVGAYVAKRFAYKMGAVQENAFLNGTGQNQPLGLFTASASGINTDRNISSGNTATNISADGLINAKYALKKQYRQLPSVRWIFHRDAISRIRKLKDGDGSYIWKPGISDRPDTILEIPFEESEYAPNTFTDSQCVGLLGDLSQYWIADSMAMEIQVATELLAVSNENLFIARAECDGMPVTSEGFVRICTSA